MTAEVATPSQAIIPQRRALLQTLLLAPWLGALSTLARAAAPLRSDGSRQTVAPFALADVRLLPGAFEHAQTLDGRYLLSLQPDRLLHNFRVNAGLAPKAPVYGGWESQEPWVDIRCHGHTLGHYLSACSMMAAATGEAIYGQRVDYLVRELQTCQLAAHSGMVSAFPDGDLQLRNSLTGQPVTGVPWYTQHKVMAGLRDAHLFVQHPAALPVLRAMADWIDVAARDCPESRFQQMLEVEHGGMNEVLADLHALTGEARYLALAQRFSHQALLQPLAQGHDPLDGLHSNTQIPKVLGFARLHELTGQAHYGQAAEFFWKTVVDKRSFATGGNGDVEHFFPTTEVRQHLTSAKTMETCSTHNMLRLTRALFIGRPDATYGDYYERALINGILASQDPDSGMMTYFQATRPGYPKLYCTPEHSFWCCTGTGMENHAKYGDSIYFHDGNTLLVNLFIASELNWTEQQVHVRQLTAFPDEAGTRLTLRVAAPKRLTLKIRHPAWCRQASITLNGKALAWPGAPEGYITLERTWHDGDTLQVHLPMHLHVQPLPGVPDVAALMYGPVVLAARMGTEGMASGADLIVNERNYGEVLKLPTDMPRLALDPAALETQVQRQAGPQLAFRLRAAQPDTTFELVPFHRIAHERYNLYWQLS
jgi:DUF1680 family protein